MIKTDFLIVGSGIAGLSLALKLTKLGNVTILTKRDISAGSTGLAQGGIAGVRLADSKHQTLDDSFEEHYKDTLKAGAYLNDKKAVKYLVKHATDALRFLEEYGVKFDVSMHREGGHSKPRISHVADETGRAVQEILVEKVKKNKKITVFENSFVVDLIVQNNEVKGVYYVTINKEAKTENKKNSNFYALESELFFSNKTILSTGGAGQIYSKTTNPSVVTGDGIAMAIRAGVEVKDLEFIQFHPTAFDYPRDPMFLLSEALRGEGAFLRNEKGERFVNELAPRDVVARAIFEQAFKEKNKVRSSQLAVDGKNTTSSKVYLDFTHEDRSVLAKKFPNIFENLLTAGYDLSKNLIPITPVAHFLCGGIKTDIKGRTNLKNLYAVGECACTGVHGANRLASNSLLEAVVFAEAIFKSITNYKLQITNDSKNSKKNVSCFMFNTLQNSKFQFETQQDSFIRKQIQELMWKNVGLVRNQKDLKNTLKKLQRLKPKGSETCNILELAKAVTKAAIKRKKSIGCHYLNKSI